jgi:hypothetical protein
MSGKVAEGALRSLRSSLESMIGQTLVDEVAPVGNRLNNGFVITSME